MITPYMETKQHFITAVQQYMVAEKQLRLINEKVKLLRETKHALNSQICTFICTNQMQRTKIELSEGELKMVEKRDYSPLTFTLVQSCLTDKLGDTELVSDIMQHIRAKRSVKSDMELKWVLPKYHETQSSISTNI